MSLINTFLVATCLLFANTVEATTHPSDSLSKSEKDSQTIISLQEQPFRGLARLKIENDMLIARTKTDRYFTSGTRMDYLFLKNPSPKLWVSKIFPHLKNADNYTGITLASNMYTPADKSENIALGDRPYSGWLFGGMYNVSNHAASATRFTTEYTLGVIGAGAMQEPMQSSWHKVINRPMPKGWQNQIATDVALTLNFVGEKRLLQPAEYVDIIAFVEANVGTVMNYGGGGGMVRLGWFNDYFESVLPVRTREKQAKWQAFIYFRPTVRIVADNALLQGGVFTYSKSPYTIQPDDVSRYYMESEFGYSLSYRGINMTYSQSVRTAEFKKAKNMFWGAMTFSVGF